jgi:DNA polymerase-4
MHVDMNSCFATIEQQANPLLRGRPIAVSPYTSPRGIIIAPSVEAKKLGIKLGIRNEEARRICPDIVILPPDPAKYRDAHTRFKNIFMSYTNNVAPKSIDEAVIDFTGSPIIKFKSMIEIAKEIKIRIKQEVGEWVRVSAGIGTNRFLAKVAAGLNKPDGLDVIDENNLLDVLRNLELVDLPGINVRNEARLNSAGIFNPLQFFDAPMNLLKKQVFQSVMGYYWYIRLRGWEIDDVEFGKKSIGHTYALGQKTSDKEQLARLLMKLCVKVGRRLRHNEFYAEGVHVGLLYRNGSGWHKGHRTKTRLYTDQEIYRHALRLLNMQPTSQVVTNLAISVYDLRPFKPEQAGLFDGTRSDPVALIHATDAINDRYGEFVITPALMAAMDNTIVDRIAFGGVKDLEDLYGES